MILGIDFLYNTNVVLTYAEGTFATRQYKGTTSVKSPKKDADEIYSSLFGAVDIYINNLG